MGTSRTPSKVTLLPGTTIFAESKSWQDSARTACFLKAHLAILDVHVAAALTHPIQCLRLDLTPRVSDVFKDEASHPKTTSTENVSFTHTEVYFPEASIHWPSLYTMRPPPSFWFQSFPLHYVCDQPKPFWFQFLLLHYVCDHPKSSRFLNAPSLGMASCFPLLNIH